MLNILVVSVKICSIFKIQVFENEKIYKYKAPGLFFHLFYLYSSKLKQDQINIALVEGSLHKPQSLWYRRDLC